MQAFPFEAIDQVEGELRLLQRLPSADGNPAFGNEIPVSQNLLDQILAGSRLASLQIPRIGIMTIAASEGAPLQKDHIAQTRAVQGTQTLHRMDRSNY